MATLGIKEGKEEEGGCAVSGLLLQPFSPYVEKKMHLDGQLEVGVTPHEPRA